MQEPDDAPNKASVKTEPVDASTAPQAPSAGEGPEYSQDAQPVFPRSGTEFSETLVDEPDDYPPLEAPGSEAAAELSATHEAAEDLGSEVPQADVREPQVPQADAPEPHVPQAHAPKPEVSQADAPEPQVLQADVRKPQLPRADAPEPQVLQAIAPNAAVAQIETAPADFPEKDGDLKPQSNEADKEVQHFLYELASLPPAVLSDNAIMHRLRRLFKPRMNGEYQSGITPELLRLWDDTAGGGRDKVKFMFEKCAYSPDWY